MAIPWYLYGLEAVSMMESMRRGAWGLVSYMRGVSPGPPPLETIQGRGRTPKPYGEGLGASSLECLGSPLACGLSRPSRGAGGPLNSTARGLGPRPLDSWGLPWPAASRDHQGARADPLNSTARGLGPRLHTWWGLPWPAASRGRGRTLKLYGEGLGASSLRFLGSPLACGLSRTRADPQIL